MDSLAVYVVDDDDDVRDSLVRLIASANLTVHGCESAQAFLQALVPSSLGALVLDVRMPGIDGLELQRSLIARGIDVPIIFLTGHGDVPMSATAFRNGAFDFMEKPVDGDMLLQAVRAALALTERNRKSQAHAAQIEEVIGRLTTRERQVLSHVVAGASSKEIARMLGVSHRTVEAHRMQIMKKTGAQSLAALIRIAIESDVAPHSN